MLLLTKLVALWVVGLVLVDGKFTKLPINLPPTITYIPPIRYIAQGPGNLMDISSGIVKLDDNWFCDNLYKARPPKADLYLKSGLVYYFVDRNPNSLVPSEVSKVETSKDLYTTILAARKEFLRLGGIITALDLAIDSRSQAGRSLAAKHTKYYCAFVDPAQDASLLPFYQYYTMASICTRTNDLASGGVGRVSMGQYMAFCKQTPSALNPLLHDYLNVVRGSLAPEEASDSIAAEIIGGSCGDAGSGNTFI